jgi:neutral ceramidase
MLPALLLAALPVIAADLRVGTARVRITPPEGAPLAGYYHNRAATGTHDDLWAKALILEKDGVTAALVACDLIGIPRPIAEAARAGAQAATGIPAANIMISATHAHTGPVIHTPGSRYNLEGRMAEIARDYAAALPGLIADSVKQARAAMVPARVSTATGRADNLTFNRRFFLKDGTVGWNPGKFNPRVDRPAGPTDPSVPVVYFTTGKDTPVATYVNFALHLDTVGGTDFSADYPFTLSTLLGNAKSRDMLTLFTIGTAGNLNHVNVNWADPQRGHGEAARIGTELAAEVLRAYRALTPVAPGELRVSSEIVNLPLAPFDQAEIAKSREIAAKFGKPNAAPFLDLVQAFKVLEVAARQGKPIEAEVQVIALGDQLAWVGLPGEIFVELGQMLKTKSPFRQTILAELANGLIGYVPNREAWPEGNYEVVSARCAQGSGEMLVDSALRQLRDAYKAAKK